MKAMQAMKTKEKIDALMEKTIELGKVMEKMLKDNG